MANAHRIEGAGKSRDLETLTGMRTALSWSDIDRDIATQPKIKLPDRRFLNLWSSYDLWQFRAAEEDWKDWEAQKDEVTKRQMDSAGREAKRHQHGRPGLRRRGPGRNGAEGQGDAAESAQHGSARSAAEAGDAS